MLGKEKTKYRKETQLLFPLRERLQHFPFSMRHQRVYVIQTGKQQETLQSIFTFSDTRESNHKIKDDRKPDFVACDMVES